MDRIDIELFLAIVKWKSITRVSEIKHFSQPTVSYRLKALEKELGVRLFYRQQGSQASELTPQGEWFVDIAQRWLAAYQDAQELVHYPKHLLNIGAINSVTVSILSEVYSKVSLPPHSLHLSVMTKYSEEIYNLMEEYLLDIGFVAEYDTRPNVITTPLFQQKYYVARYAKYPSLGETINPKDLDLTQEIYMYWNSEFENWHKSVFGEAPMYRASIDNVGLLPVFLREEGGWAVVPNSLVPSLVSLSQNIQVDELMVPEVNARTCYMIKHRNPRASRADSLRIFEEELYASLKKNPYVELI